MKTLTNSETCTENCIRISYHLCHLSFFSTWSPLTGHGEKGLNIHVMGGLRNNFQNHSWVPEQVLQKQADFWYPGNLENGYWKKQVKTYKWFSMQKKIKTTSAYTGHQKNFIPWHSPFKHLMHKPPNPPALVPADLCSYQAKTTLHRPPGFFKYVIIIFIGHFTIIKSCVPTNCL